MKINRNLKTKMAAAADAALQGTLPRIALVGARPVGKGDTFHAEKNDSDERTGRALAEQVIAEARDQTRGQWLRFVAKLVPMTPKARSAFMGALREHRDAIKAHAKSIGTEVALRAAAAASTWLSYMATIAGALQAGMGVECLQDSDGTPRHDAGGNLLLAHPFTHILAEARIFRAAHAAAAQEGRVQAITRAGIGITEEQARALVAHEQAEKRGRKAKPFAQVCTEAAEKRAASPDDIKAAIAALQGLLK